MAKTGIIAIPPATAATDSPSIESGQWDKVTAIATNLAGVEEVVVKVVVGTTSIPFFVSGTAAKLTVAAPVLTLPGGPSYIFSKPLTAGASGVYYYPQPY